MSIVAITPELVLKAYASGVFPMAESREADTLFWVDPNERGILPLDGFHISRKLAKTLRTDYFRVTINRAFTAVIEACSMVRKADSDTWINQTIIDLYTALHRAGHVHSVECWRDDKLAGGLYGVSLGGAFFGESMFHRETDASKVALVHLVARLKAGGYSLLDTQFVTDHLAQFGALEISRNQYLKKLDQALHINGDFYLLNETVAGSEILQSITHTS